MTKLKFLKDNMDIREILKKTALSSLVTSAFVFLILKDRFAINKKLFIPQPFKGCQVSFVNTPNPFATISMNLNCRYVKPVVERFQENISKTAEGGDVMAKHSKEVVRFVAAKGQRTLKPCKGEALDCFPKGNHARAKPLIVSRRETMQGLLKSKIRAFSFQNALDQARSACMITQRVIILCFF